MCSFCFKLKKHEVEFEAQTILLVINRVIYRTIEETCFVFLCRLELKFQRDMITDIYATNFLFFCLFKNIFKD